MFILGLGGLALLAISAGKTHEPVTPPATKKATGLDTPNIPKVIAERALKMAQTDALNQIVWLNDNGYTLTGSAIDRYFRDEATAAEVIKIAEAEWLSKLNA